MVEVETRHRHQILLLPFWLLLQRVTCIHWCLVLIENIRSQYIRNFIILSFLMLVQQTRVKMCKPQCVKDFWPHGICVNYPVSLVLENVPPLRAPSEMQFADRTMPRKQHCTLFYHFLQVLVSRYNKIIYIYLATTRRQLTVFLLKRNVTVHNKKTVDCFRFIMKLLSSVVSDSTTHIKNHCDMVMLLQRTACNVIIA